MIFLLQSTSSVARFQTLSICPSNRPKWWRKTKLERARVAAVVAEILRAARDAASYYNKRGIMAQIIPSAWTWLLSDAEATLVQRSVGMRDLALCRLFCVRAGRKHTRRAPWLDGFV